ncbi:dihydrolipoyl dehydrogenase [Pontibacter sp. G13]|uniref:dihydrolipoyl dehydrogenase n=1 Tax=Pontibacter sp. G13 TaxID=3074898 RepID=UPI00288A75E3|nr:dihydrolipoyl dehydrogenase [Pontibacter sp. G13]WNJ17401.1 dihydrolipoyl dehydrogenase [Pontibacter sp. G13]
MANTTFDVTVIGSGPGGYVAAIRCAQLGMKVAIIEKYPTLGGTCLNVGCIPSKALLDSSEHYHQAVHQFAEHGIKVPTVELDLPQMIKRKAGVVEKTTSGVAYLMKKNKITVFQGFGSFVDANTIKVTKDDGSSEEVKTQKVIIATGSKPASLPGIEIDKKHIISSTEALELTELPKHMIVIGGGVIGVEMASVFGRIGSKITVLEYADKLIPSMDGALGKELAKSMKKEMDFTALTSHKVTGSEVKDGKVIITAENKKGETVTVEGDVCLMAVGRRPYTDNLGLENIGIETDRGRIPVSDQLQTSVPNIYAIGDVVRGAMLAHKASEEGVFVAEVIAGQHPHINYRAIPGVVYTWPEVASVGYTEEELKANGTKYKVGNFPFKASGRARASMDDSFGFVKILADKETDEMLGMHIIGPRAADMIMEGVMGLEFRASAEDLAIFSHPHPTFSESVKEAAMGATANRVIHM